MARLAIVLIDQWADWEPALLASGARDDFGDEVRFLSPGGQPVRSMGGLLANVDGDVEDFEPGHADAIAVIGSPLWATDASPVVTPVLRMAADAGLTVGGICGATLALARAGLLDTRAHTSNGLEFLQQHAAGYHGSERYRDQAQAVSDQRVVSASGLAPATFAAQMLRALHPDKDKEIAQMLEYFAREHQRA